MKNSLTLSIALILAALVLSACGSTPPVALSPTAQSPTGNVPTATALPPVPVGAPSVNFSLPPALGAGTTMTTVFAVEGPDQPVYALAPAHLQFDVQDYPVSGSAIQPALYVYPAEAYRTANVAAAHSLDKLLALGASDVAVTRDNMPTVPFYNAALVFVANAQRVTTPDLQGVRAVAFYSQYPSSANNKFLLYQFQGLTHDGRYYVIAILPINATFLAADDDPNTTLPPDGIPLPASGPEKAYYDAVIARLNESEATLTPALTALDAFVQTITVR